MLRAALRPILQVLAAITLYGGPGILLVPRASATPTYSVKILGTLRTDGTGSSTAGGINDAGVVAGSASTASGQVLIRWREATGMSDHGKLVPPYDTYGLSINSAEVLCGFGLTQSSGFAGAFHENPAGPIQALPRFSGGGDAYAYAIAESGVCAGWSNAGSGCGSPTCAGNPGHAVVWDSTGVLTLLPTIGGYFSVATDISPDGSEICGYGADPSNAIRAFRIVSGVATALPPLAGYTESQAWGVNDAGQVVGYSALGDSRRATLWNADTPIDLGATAGSLGSVATRISEAGVIVGYVLLPGSADLATTFEPGSPPTDLNTVLDTSSPYTLLYCNDVNASGQIVGAADSAGTARGFVLTPAATAAVEPGRPRSDLDLRAPLPNPSRAGASLRFSLAEAGHERLDVLDLGGRVIAHVSDAWLPAGEHAIGWNGRDARGDLVRPGVFFVRLASADRIATRKLVVSR